MAKKDLAEAKNAQNKSIGFQPWMLLVFSIGLVLAGGLLGSGLVAFRSGPVYHPKLSSSRSVEKLQDPAPETVPPWGELITYDIWIARPEEYLADEIRTNQPVTWIFNAPSPEQVRGLLNSFGFTAAQMDYLLSANRITSTANSTAIQPGDEFVFSLPPKTRVALYEELARNPVNQSYWMPFVFQRPEIEAWFAGSGLGPDVIALATRLIYKRGSTLCFGDMGVMMRALPTDKQRFAFVKAISRQPALLARLRVRPDTDVQKILGYWDRGVHVKDALPLLDSLKRLPDGGSLSLLNILPPFARERLFTFPKPLKPGQPVMDCHWSTFNFFNDTPDSRFSDGNFVGKYIDDNFYPLSKATRYGDVIVLMQGQSNVIHSAVYLADDIVFTKNGNNINQPWTLMRMKDLLTVYEFLPQIRVVNYRRNNW